MTRRRIAWTFVAGLAALLGAAALALVVWLPDEAQLARIAGSRLTQALGVPVTIGQLHWRLLPTPMVSVAEVRTQQDEPITIGRATGWPRLGPLMHGQVAFRRVEVEGATLPQDSLHALSGAEDRPQGAGRWHAAGTPVERLEFRDITWVGRRSIPLEFEGAVDFDAGWRPRHAELARPGVSPEARVVLDRLGQDQRWRADTTIAGGTWNGTLALEQTGERFRLTGELDPKGVEVQQLLAAFKRKSVVQGRASGHSTLEAEGTSLGEAVRSLHTRTRFAMAPATLLRFDLEKAIKSLGKEHDGATRLDSLSGQVDTENGPEGIVVRYSALKAKSGVLSASGEATLANRRVDATLAVDLVEGIAGVPLKISGPVTKPEVSVPASAVAGAAVGTAVLPGVGTAVGARVGSMFDRLFGRDRKVPPPAGARSR